MRPRTPHTPSRPLAAIGLVALAAVSALVASRASAQEQAEVEAASEAEALEALEREEDHFWKRVYDPDRKVYDDALGEAASAFVRGERDKLEGAVAKALELRPNAAGALYFKALLLGMDKDHAASEAILAELVGREGLDPHEVSLEAIWADRALALTQLERYEEAVACWEQALGVGRVHQEHALDRGNRPIYLSNMAELHVALRRLDEAETLYQAAIQDSPSYVQAYYGLAAALERRGDHARARSWVLAGVLKDPELKRLSAPGVFFVPEGEGELRRGLAEEELGDVEAAATWYERALEAQGEDEPGAAAIRAALDRVRSRRSAVLGQGGLPLYRPTAAAADPKGRAIAFGDALGRVVLVRLGEAAARPPKMLLTSGPEVVGLAFDAEGRLIVVRDDGYARVMGLDGRLGELIGPIALPSGTQVKALTPDGRGVLVSAGRSRLWGLASLDQPEKELGRFTTRQAVFGATLTPIHGKRRQATAVFWSSSRSLNLQDVPSPKGQGGRSAPIVNPHGVATVGVTRDGRHLVVAGPSTVATMRTSDLGVVRMVRVGGRTRKPIHVLVDDAGAGGLGAAVVLVYPHTWRALRLSALGLEGSAE